jgi:hypothetical protein
VVPPLQEIIPDRQIVPLIGHPQPPRLERVLQLHILRARRVGQRRPLRLRLLERRLLLARLVDLHQHLEKQNAISSATAHPNPGRLQIIFAIVLCFFPSIRCLLERGLLLARLVDLHQHLEKDKQCIIKHVIRNCNGQEIMYAMVFRSTKCFRCSEPPLLKRGPCCLLDWFISTSTWRGEKTT